jgi:hypothetical protein
MTSKVDETRQVAGALHPNDAIVVLKKPQLEGVGTEEDFLDCLQQNLGGELVHPEQGQTSKVSKNRSHIPFRSTASRNSRTPCSRGSSRALHRQMPPGSRRYSIVPVSWTGSRKSVCGTSSGSTATRRRPMAAAAWPAQPDRGRGLHRYRLVGKAFRLRGLGVGPADRGRDGFRTTDVKGTSVLIGAIAPIPIISPVQSTACNRLAEQLRSFLVGDDLEGEAPAASTPSGGGSTGTR